MSRQSATVVVVAIVVLLSGCHAITDSPTTDRGPHRLVVANGYGTAQNVTVTINVHGDGPVINESRQLTAGQQWAVTTLNQSVLDNSGGYTMAVSTARGSVRHETGASGTGATLIVIGEGRVVTCGGSLTCYEKTA